MIEVITVEPKAFDDVPIVPLIVASVKLLAKYGLELDFQPGKPLVIRRIQQKKAVVVKGTK